MKLGGKMKKQFSKLLIVLSCITLISCASTKKENNKNFTGWIESEASKIEVLAGYVKMVVKPKMGSFNFYVVDSNLKEEAVLSSANEFSASAFYLKCGNDIYKLNASTGVKSEAYKVDNGVVVKYFVPKVANVTIYFDCLKSSVDTDFDMVKISASVKNTSKNTNNFALKCVLDTVFGENKKYHFYTSNDVGIKNETLYRTMKNEKWFVSKNDNNAVQILLDGADITTPEVVVLANKLTFESNSWELTVSSKKTFDNVLSYNDSAVCVIWPEKNLNQEASFTESFYLAVASDGAKTYGYDYILAKEKNLPMESTPVIVEPKKEVYAEPEPVKEDRFIPNVKFDVTTLSKEKFTQEYIQSLIDRISELEDDGANTNRTELLMLNAELDAILEVLRQ